MKEDNLLYHLEDRPPFSISLLLAAQHLLAALGGIIAVPLVIGSALGLPSAEKVALVNAALLVSGAVTFVQSRGIGPIGLKLPAVMGTSFTFVASAIAIGNSEYGVAGILGSSLVASLVMIIGSFFMPQIRKLFPPVVTGTVVAMIGLSLLPVGLDWFAGGQVGSPQYASGPNLLVAFFVLFVVIALTQWGKGILASASIVIGMIVGYLAVIILEKGFGYELGLVDFSGVESAKVFALPSLFEYGFAFPISGIIGMSIAYLVTIVESSGNFLALGEATQTKVTGKRMKAGILCEGLGSALAALMSTTPFSTFAQNIGIISLTGVASRFVVAMAGILLLFAGIFPIFGALVVSIPLPVLGGAGLMMFAMIIAAGIQVLGRVEINKRNGLVISVSLGLGLMVTMRPEVLNALPEFVQVIFKSGITVGSLSALILNLILPGREIVTDDEAEA
mgnify:CR=1 FL=1